MSDLLKRSKWTDPSIDIYVGEIIEYDMKDGGNSILHEEKMVPQAELDKIDAMPKGLARNSYVGKLNYKYKGIGKELEQMFCKYRCLFGEKNELTDNDILSIKRDAIFVKRYCYETKFGKHVQFAEKHVYRVYMCIGKLEFYWADNGDLAVKGIRDEQLVRHKEFIMKIIWKYMRHLYNMDERGALRYIVRMMNDYKMLKLDPDYYREFNDDSKFQLIYGDTRMPLTEVGESYVPQLDISYNYMNILVPMLNMVSGC